MNKKYIINQATTALISYFYNGYEYSHVIEGKDIFIVHQSPDEIVRDSFLHLGSSLKGAIESARLILKQRYKLPLCLSTQHNIYLIRCHTKLKPGTIWLVNSHIDDILPEPTDKTKSIIRMKHGHSLIVDIKAELLQPRRNQATFLHSVLLERSKMNKTMTYLYEKDKGFMLVKNHGQLNYLVQSKEKEENKK